MRDYLRLLVAGFATSSVILLSGCTSPTAALSPIPPTSTVPTAEPSPPPPTSTAPPPEPLPPETSEPTQESDFKKTGDLGYTGSQLVDVYYPADSGTWPVIVMLHGAGGDKAQYAPGAAELAARGAVVFAANWRSEPWIHGEMAMMEDTACSVRYARSVAEEYGGDPSRLVLFVHSMAGWSGATIALSGDDFVGDCAIDGVSAIPSALVGYAGAYDAGESNPDGGASFLKEEDPELWDLIYPYAHIGSNLETVFHLIAGDQDQHDIEVSERFLAALLEAGYEAEMAILGGVGHNGPAPGTPEFDTLMTAILNAGGG